MPRAMGGCFSQNMDKLRNDELDLVRYAFGPDESLIEAIEVRLDDPIENMMVGGEGFITHYLSGGNCYLRHKGKPDWAIIQRGAATGDYDNGRRVAVEWANKVREIEIWLGDQT